MTSFLPPFLHPSLPPFFLSLLFFPPSFFMLPSSFNLPSNNNQHFIKKGNKIEELSWDIWGGG